MATNGHRSGAAPKWRQDLFESDALRINLEETAVDRVAVDPKYEVLRTAVADYRGILKTLDTLLFELNHPFKNWEIILPELRAFALKNFASYARHPRGPEAIAVIIGVFLDAVTNSSREDLQSRAIDYLLGYIEKIISEWNSSTQDGLLAVLNTCFRGLSSIPENKFFLLASSHIPLKRIGQVLLRKVPGNLELSEFNELLVHSLRAAYGYWLQEEDPGHWFADQEPDFLKEISHKRLREYLSSLEQLSSGDGSTETLQSLLAFPEYLEIVRATGKFPTAWKVIPRRGREGIGTLWPETGRFSPSSRLWRSRAYGIFTKKPCGKLIIP